MSIIIKCKNCNGRGYVPMGFGIRGLVVCKVCNGIGTYENDEIININNEPFYKILNGTSYDYAPIPKKFKPYFEKLQQENEKLNHYKLLYQKVKERNEKTVAYIEDRYDSEQKALTHTFDKDNVGELLDILEGNNQPISLEEFDDYVIGDNEELWED